MNVAVAAIGIYQRYVSPYKGFRCAYRTLLGGHSCSEFCRVLLLTTPFRRAWPRMKDRFVQCYAAAVVLNESKASNEGEPPGDAKERKWWEHPGWCYADGAGCCMLWT